MTTVADLVEDTRRLVYGTTRQEHNALASAIDASTTTLLFTYDLQGITRGAFITIDYEMMYVLDAVSSTKTITVIRGYLGTVPATHAIGTQVEVNGRFPRPFILDELINAIRAMPPRLFTVKSVTISGTTGLYLYEINSKALHVLDVYYAPTASRPRIRSISDYHFLTNYDQGAGSFIQINSDPGSQGLIRVTVALPFDWAVNPILTTTDVEAADTGLGMPNNMHDIPAYDAAYRLMATKEVVRANLMAQPEPRTAEEVPPGHLTSAANALRKVRDDRIAEEVLRLRERYPIRRSV
jgi:hypothetical protein